MNPVHQTSIQRVRIVLNIHKINHINQIGPTLKPSLPSWGFDNKHEELQSTLEKSINIMQQCMLQTSQINQKIIESSARIDIHFDKIMTYLNQPASNPISDQTQEFHQCC